jgi:hypothetical protein
VSGAYDRNRTLLVCPFFRGLDSECIYGLPTKRVYEDSTHFLALESYLRSHFFLRLPFYRWCRCCGAILSDAVPVVIDAIPLRKWNLALLYF